jgi:plasmid maintenance system killer protein
MKRDNLHLDFLDGTLRRLAYEPGFRLAGWEDAEVHQFHLVVQCASAAKTGADLRATRCLRLRPYSDDDPNTLSAQLSPRHRLLLTLKNDTTPATAVLSVLSTETDERR